MHLVLKRDLTPLKTAAIEKINRAADLACARLIRPIHADKRREAEAIAVCPSIAPAEVPILAMEASADGVSLLDKSAEVLTKAHECQQAVAILEARRRTAKAAVNAATNPAAIDMIDIEALA